jgi:hypothetical protein
MTDKQKFDLQMVYNNFGYNSPEEIPFKNTGPALYMTNFTAMYNIEFIKEFIDAIDIIDYVKVIFYYFTFHSYEFNSPTGKEEVEAILGYILDYNDITFNEMDYILRGISMSTTFINEHYASIDKYANEIRDKNFLNPDYITTPKGFYTEEMKMRAFYSYNATDSFLSVLKENLKIYYYFRELNEKGLTEDDLN